MGRRQRGGDARPGRAQRRDRGYAVQLLAKPDPFVVGQAACHSADEDRNGKLSLFELTRVIELYNVHSGTTRTGQYRVQSGTEDGFAPGP